MWRPRHEACAACNTERDAMADPARPNTQDTPAPLPGTVAVIDAEELRASEDDPRVDEFLREADEYLAALKAAGLDS